ncbi:hypothetical protein RHS01_08572 [Rhizoctonia solani]|uniref:Protein F37C4,5 [Caenorhabditis elegans] n=1 Tax=Rhizoctonia solani TaxID=456999 RepID=A0A8H7I7N0_9AGAM|nr:hypothetical protein RHS01_08572 [Rhizoctonia solani]
MRYSTDPSPAGMKQIVIDAQDHPIEAVTVFDQRAEVRRIITLELDAGRNDFAIKNLPSGIVPDTLHFAGLSAGQASTSRTSPAQRINEKITELEAKKRELLRELSLINARSDVLLSYANSLNGENTEPGDFVEFLGHFNAAGQATLEATTRIENGVREIDASIGRIKANEESEDEGDKIQELSVKRKTKASVVLSAKEACSIKLSLTYVVNGAGWKPAYELHAITDSKTQAIANNATLHYHASILQTTGEDWEDVQLTLSTASSAYSSYVPYLGKSIIKAGTAQCDILRLFGAAPTNTVGFGSATSAYLFNTGATSGGLFGAAATNNVGNHAATSAPSSSVLASGPFSSEATAREEFGVVVESNPDMHALDRVGAAVNDQALASTYSIETNVTVQSDDIPHRVTIMSAQLGAKTQYITVPKLSRAVYLSCKMINSTTHQFLPGPLVTYLDNSYVDTTTLPLVPVKESDKVVGFAQRKYTPVTDTITIKNTHPFAIPRILVRHAIPTPQDDQFRVVLINPEDMAGLEPGKEYKLREKVKGRWMDDATSGLDVSGLVEWTIDNLEADAKEEIKMVYEVAAPQDVEWHQS